MLIIITTATSIFFLMG